MTDDRSTSEAWTDPIVAEVRQAREELFSAANYDIYEFCRRLTERQATSGHAVVKRGAALMEGSSGMGTEGKPAISRA